MRDLLNPDVANGPLSGIMVALFLVVFVVITYRVFMRTRRGEFERGSRLPLDD